MALPSPRRSGGKDLLSAELIADRSFPVARRGFERSDVQEFLRQVADAVATLHHRLDEAEEARQVAEERARHPEISEDVLMARVGEETAAILRSARAAAADMQKRAGDEAARIVDDAHQTAAGIRSEAEAAKARTTQEAARAAEEIRNAAQASAEQLLDHTRQEVESLRQAAEQERKLMVESAQSVREKILADLTRRRRVATVQIEQLRAGRERLLQAYGVVRTTLQDVNDELQRADAEARAAADDAGRAWEHAELPDLPPDLLAALQPAPSTTATTSTVEAVEAAEATSTPASDPAPAGGEPTAKVTAADLGLDFERSGRSAPPEPSTDDDPPSGPGPTPGGTAPAGTPGTPGTPSGPSPSGGAGTSSGAGAGPGRAKAPGKDASSSTTSSSSSSKDRRRPTSPPSPTRGGGTGPADAPAATGDKAPNAGTGADATPVAETAKAKPATEAAKAKLATEAAKTEPATPAEPGKVETGKAETATAKGGRVETGKGGTVLPAKGDGPATGTDAGAAPAAKPATGAGTASPGREPAGQAGPTNGTPAPPAGPGGSGRGGASRSHSAKPASKGSGAKGPGGRSAAKAKATGATATIEADTAHSADTADTAAPAVEDDDRTGGIFDRIRAGREEAVDAARRTLQEEAVQEDRDEAPTAAGAAKPDLPQQVSGAAAATLAEQATDDEEGSGVARSSVDEELLERRDLVLGELDVILTRKLKRALQDEQNSLLDRLRNAKGEPGVGVLLGAEADQRRRYYDAALPQLELAAREGARFAADIISERGGKTATKRAPKVDDLATELATELGGHIRRRVEAALGAGRGDEPSALVEAIGAAYREIKTQRVESSAGDMAVGAFSRGIWETVGDRIPLRWVVEDVDGPCADCDDNALAGGLPRHEAFPTGQAHPPAHAGCRCLLVPEPS